MATSLLCGEVGVPVSEGGDCRLRLEGKGGGMGRGGGGRAFGATSNITTHYECWATTVHIHVRTAYTADSVM